MNKLEVIRNGGRSPNSLVERGDLFLVEEDGEQLDILIMTSTDGVLHLHSLEGGARWKYDDYDGYTVREVLDSLINEAEWLGSSCRITVEVTNE